MSQAYDLAVSVCSMATSSPGIVHDPASPLVLGSPQTGEFLVWTYDQITHTAEMQVASDVINMVSTFSLRADGELLINGQPLASTGNVDDAVGDAQAAAAAAAASANAATQTLIDVNASKTQIDATVQQFATDSGLAIDEMAAQAARAEVAIADAEGLRSAAAASAEVATRAAGDSQAWAVESQHRASSDPSYIFEDGTKSARGYAYDAAQSASLNRAAVTRNLVAADLPETFAPGKLFTRARCMNTAAGIVNIGPNIWTDTAGEAWATYRLEKTGGSIKFVGAGGTSTITAPGLNSNALTCKARGPMPVALSNSVIATCAPPAGFTGRVVIMLAFMTPDGVAFTLSPSFSGGVAVITRIGPVSPAPSSGSVMGVIYEGAITSWPGGDLNFSMAFTPGIWYLVGRPLLVTGGDAALTPISGFIKSSAVASTQTLSLPSVPAQSLVLATAFQMRLAASFSSWGANMALIDKGNLLGAGPGAVDNSDYRNGSYGIGQGVAGGTGNFPISCSYAAAADRVAIVGIAYQPGSGAAASVVDMTFAGGRDTLTEVGAEAEVWFNSDGRSVFVQVPK